MILFSSTSSALLPETTNEYIQIYMIDFCSAAALVTCIMKVGACSCSIQTTPHSS